MGRCQVKVGTNMPRRGNKLSVWLGRFLLAVIRWRVVGSLPNVSKAVIIGAPHTSNYDGLVAAATILSLQVRISILAKHTLFRGPFGWFFRFLGGIPVDRSGPHGMVDLSVQEFANRQQLLLGMAPEGTRKHAQEFKTGFYRIALNAGVPIVVAVLDYGKRQVNLALTLEPSGDMDADIEKILACYRDAKPAKPERLSEPLRRL